MKKRLSKIEIEQIDGFQFDYKKAKSFLHCKNCIDQFLGSQLHEVMTPREYGMYEASTYDFTYPDGSISTIIVFWCKRCGRSMWDSRNLKKMY